MEDHSISGLDYAKEVGKHIVTEVILPPMKRHIDYWWSCPDNIQSLSDETRLLKRARLDTDQRIEEARCRAESATTGVGIWSDEGTQMLEESDRILKGYNELKPWNMISRYQVGKCAKKQAYAIAKHRREGDSIRISHPPPPPSMAPIPYVPTMEFESRKHVEEGITESLKDDQVYMIAICGPGGVGKTTMVQRIEDRVRKENIFDEVVKVVVSQQIDMLKIQKEIAEILGLNLCETTLASRAHKIRTRLLDSKTKLVIFDDVWKSFNLNEIGVPLGNGFEGCKIILTSRLKDVCEEMGADKVFQIEILDEAESWRLFREKSGFHEDDSLLRPVAEAIAAECRGLPIALVPIAKALKNKSKWTWEDSLLQLKKANPTNFPRVLKDVYMPLKLSYDFLETETEKSLFLLCCLFPEDSYISIEKLTLYSIGLGLLEGILSINEGRNRTHHLVEKLKSRFLLIDCDGRDHVKMHDVVRDVAIFIGSKEKHGFLKCLQVSPVDSPSLDSSCDCHWMSIDISNENLELPIVAAFQNLRLLLINKPSLVLKPERIKDDTDIMGGMKELNVLSFLGINIVSFPAPQESLKKLTMLDLYDSNVGDIFHVGELTSLKILQIRFCTNIEELPANIGRLNRLRLLELSNCRNLKRVAAGVISSLVGLEELKIVDSFDQWGAKVNESEERNASLLELQSLCNLTWLKIKVSDTILVALQIYLSRPLLRYHIHFTEDKIRYLRYFFKYDLKYDVEYEREIRLHLPGDVITVGDWIHQLVRSTQSLKLNGDGSNIFKLYEIGDLKRLIFTNCSTVKKIDCKFHLLEHLCLERLEEVEWIVDGTIPNFFPKLQVLEVRRLPKLAHLWICPNQNVSLPNLKRIAISDCPNLRALFSLESNLEDESVEFPQLTELRIISCPKLTTKIGKCPNLQSIVLDAFSGLHHLLSSNCHRTWIKQLRYLSIRNCDTIQEIFWDDIEEEGNRHIIFSKLEELGLGGLPCLTTFYRGVETINFPKLRRMQITGSLTRMNNNSLVPMDSETSHDDHSLHFFCNEKVKIPCLENLGILGLQDDISRMWCRHVPDNFFHNLKYLWINEVNGIRNLMSSSIALNLVNLSLLHIHGGKEMIEVVEDDLEISVTSLFPKLDTILLYSLPKLKSFCPWKHALEFPSLSLVYIIHSPGMETFTWGSISTPYDFELRINGGTEKTKDLNGRIREHFMNESQKVPREMTDEAAAAIDPFISF